MTKKKRIITILIIVAAAVIIAGAFLKGQDKGAEIPAIGAVSAERKPLIETITASGTFQPENSELHVSPLTARIARVYKEEGDAVKPGEIILQIEDTDFQRALEEAEVALVTARRGIAQALLANQLDYQARKVALEQAQSSYEKQLQPFALEAVSEEELNRSRDTLGTARQGFEAARQKLNLTIGNPLSAEPDLNSISPEKVIEASPEVAAAKLALTAAREALDKCRVTARKAGFITSLPQKEGDYITAGAVAVEIQSLDRMKAVITVDEVDIGKIKPGDPTVLTSDSLLGESVPGKVSFLAPVIQTIGNARASRVEIRPDDPSLPLRSGASCTAAITTVSKTSALTVPVGGVRTARGKILVYLLEKQEGDRYRLKEKEILTGLSTIDDVEVLEGLEEGQLVALNSSDMLREGLVVTLKEAE